MVANPWLITRPGNGSTPASIIANRPAIVIVATLRSPIHIKRSRMRGSSIANKGEVYATQSSVGESGYGLLAAQQFGTLNKVGLCDKDGCKNILTTAEMEKMIVSVRSISRSIEPNMIHPASPAEVMNVGT